MPNAATRPLFEEAKRLGIGFHLGYVEPCEENGVVRRFNTANLVGPDDDIVGRYRKIHLPGTAEPVSDAPFQHPEKRYFEVGNLGFPVWRAHDAIVGMCIHDGRHLLLVLEFQSSLAPRQVAISASAVAKRELAW